MPTDDPAFRGVVIPLAWSFVLAAVGLVVGWGLLPGRELRRRVAAVCLGLAVGGGTALGWFLLEGRPVFPPPQAKQKCFYVLFAALAMGLAADLWKPRRTLPVAAGMAAAVLIWIAWRPLFYRFNSELLLQVAALAGGALVVLVRLAALSRRRRATGVLAALVPGAAALAAIAYQGSSISLALFAASLAAAAGGAALAVYLGLLAGLPASAAAGSTSLWLGGGLAAVALAAVLVLFTPRADGLAVALTAVIPWVSAVVPRSRGETRGARAFYPLALIAAGAAAAAVAVGAAWLRSP